MSYFISYIMLTRCINHYVWKYEVLIIGMAALVFTNLFVQHILNIERIIKYAYVIFDCALEPHLYSPWFDVVSSYYLVSSLCSISMDTKKVGTELCQAGAGLSFAFYPVKLDF